MDDIDLSAYDAMQYAERAADFDAINYGADDFGDDG